MFLSKKAFNEVLDTRDEIVEKQLAAMKAIAERAITTTRVAIELANALHTIEPDSSAEYEIWEVAREGRWYESTLALASKARVRGATVRRRQVVETIYEPKPMPIQVDNVVHDEIEIVDYEDRKEIAA